MTCILTTRISLQLKTEEGRLWYINHSAFQCHQIIKYEPAFSGIVNLYKPTLSLILVIQTFGKSSHKPGISHYRPVQHRCESFT